MSDDLTTVDAVRGELKRLGNPEIAAHSARFFKSGPGEYAEGDQFYGIRVPVQRQVARRAKSLNLEQIVELLHSPFHEERLTALVMMVNLFKKSDPPSQERIYDSYLANTRFINNWDLVDSSAHHIVGAFLFERDRSILSRLADSDNLWERRIAIIATYYFIKRDQYMDTLLIAEVLLGDTHDLIHKAVGWMLREMGNRNRDVETAFLQRHYSGMPRTMLRYAIEKYPEPERQAFLKGTA